MRTGVSAEDGGPLGDAGITQLAGSQCILYRQSSKDGRVTVPDEGTPILGTGGRSLNRLGSASLEDAATAAPLHAMKNMQQSMRVLSVGHLTAMKLLLLGIIHSTTSFMENLGSDIEAVTAEAITKQEIIGTEAKFHAEQAVKEREMAHSIQQELHDIAVLGVASATVTIQTESSPLENRGQGLDEVAVRVLRIV